jgi:hypothetical protein
MVYIHIVKILKEASMKSCLSNASNKILIFGLFLSLLICDLSYSQRQNKIFEDIGGGSGTTNTNVESNDDYTLYIVGGLIVTGIVIYALLRDKKEKPTKDTATVSLNEDYLEKNLSYNEKIANLQAQSPINITFGIQRDKALKDEKRYFVGLAYNF